MTLPRDFEEYTRRLMGDELYTTLAEGLAQEAPTSIRLNPFKTTSCLHHDGQTAGPRQGSPVAWCAQGFYLANRPNFTFDPLLHAGLYYVQEASSMFIGHILQQLIHHPVLMLDLCAAPGGKTTAARAALPEGSLLFANEPMKLRASILSENVQKFGHPDMVVTNNFPREYQQSGLLFDVVLVDVPCSGEGMFRKDEGAIGEWSMQNVEKCRLLQRSIIEDIWPCLAEGGILIYSTCTFNAHENEENVNWIADNLGADFIDIDTPPEWGITGSLIDDHPVCRFIPGKTKGEGLFVAVLRKRGQHVPAIEQLKANTGKSGKKQRRQQLRKQDSLPSEVSCRAWVNGQFTISRKQGTVMGIPTWWQHIYEHAQKSLHILHAGMTLGTEKGHGIIPHTSLALSQAIAPDAFPRIEADYKTAISYLRKEAIALPPDAPRGFVIITYRSHSLGFVKNIGNRANNLYPQEWKIKSTYLPEHPIEVLPDTCCTQATHSLSPHRESLPESQLKEELPSQ